MNTVLNLDNILVNINYSIHYFNCGYDNAIILKYIFSTKSQCYFSLKLNKFYNY